MSIVFLVLQMFLVSASGADLEADGRLAEAGLAYESSGDVQGQLRILCRFLEESLYAGETEHAFYLIQALEGFPLEEGNLDFWYGRLAWSCGLPEMACRNLDAVTGSPWIQYRARGLAAMYRGDAEGALELLDLSWSAASSARERYYSSLDICFALVQLGRYAEAGQAASILITSFPGEGLPLIAAALCMHGEERYGSAMTTLQTLASDTLFTGITRSMASALMEDME
jgi:tetratricopeptide (TPR) repeat protein